MKYTKTEAGQAAFKTRSAALPLRLRSLYLLFDGQKSLAEVMRVAEGLGATLDDVHCLVEAGFLKEMDAMSTPTLGGVPPQAPTFQHAETGDGGPSPGQRYALALPIATQLTASLGLRGFRLNLAVEAAMGYTQLCQLVPQIRAAVGPTKIKPLEQALGLLPR